jgi:hypothetical protein
MNEEIDVYMRVIGRWSIPPSYPNASLVKRRLFPISDIPEEYAEIYKNINTEKTFITTYGHMTHALYIDRQVSFDIKMPPVEHKRLKLPEEVGSGIVILDPKYAFETFASTALRSTLHPMTEYGYFILYLEELHTGRKSQLSHRHMIRLSDIDAKWNELRTDQFNDIALIHYSDYRVRHKIKMASRMDACLIATTLLYPIDLTRLRNVYLVGSLITYAFDSNRDPKAYANSDIDLLVNRADITYVVMQIEKMVGKKAKRIETSHGFYKFTIDAHRKIEIFQAHIGSIVGYHVPMVRAAFDGSDFIVTPSFIQTFVTGCMFEYRWIKCGNTIIDVIKKYVHRGFTFIGSYIEMSMIYEQKDIPTYHFIGPLLPDGKLSTIGTFTLKGKTEYIKSRFTKNEQIEYGLLKNISKYRIILKGGHAAYTHNLWKIVLLPGQVFRKDNVFGKIKTYRLANNSGTIYEQYDPSPETCAMLKEIPESKYKTEDKAIDEKEYTGLGPLLPWHIVNNIMSYLPIYGIKRLACSSKYYASIARDAINWRTDCPDKELFDEMKLHFKNKTRQEIRNAISMPTRVLSFRTVCPLFSDQTMYVKDKSLMTDIAMTEAGKIIDEHTFRFDSYKVRRNIEYEMNGTYEQHIKELALTKICNLNGSSRLYAYEDLLMTKVFYKVAYLNKGITDSYFGRMFNIPEKDYYSTRKRRLDRYLSMPDYEYDIDDFEHITDAELEFSDDGYSSAER